MVLIECRMTTVAKKRWLLLADAIKSRSESVEDKEDVSYNTFHCSFPCKDKVAKHFTI